jgi:hypothetical protein
MGYLGRWCWYVTIVLIRCRTGTGSRNGDLGLRATTHSTLAATRTLKTRSRANIDRGRRLSLSIPLCMPITRASVPGPKPEFGRSGRRWEWILGWRRSARSEGMGSLGAWRTDPGSWPCWCSCLRVVRYRTDAGFGWGVERPSGYSYAQVNTSCQWIWTWDRRHSLGLSLRLGRIGLCTNGESGVEC